MGTVVRVVLHGRRTRGWVVGTGTAVPEGVDLKAIREIVSLGPPPDIVELCRWAAWRYAGRLRPLLLAASAPRIVRTLPEAAVVPPLTGAGPREDPGLQAALGEVLSSGDAVLRLPPTMPRLDAVLGLLERCRTADSTGDPLVLVESRSDALILGGRLRAAGWPVSILPEDWAAASAGGRVVVGTRNGVFGPRQPFARRRARRAQRVVPLRAGSHLRCPGDRRRTGAGRQSPGVLRHALPQSRAPGRPAARDPRALERATGLGNRGRPRRPGGGSP